MPSPKSALAPAVLLSALAAAATPPVGADLRAVQGSMAELQPTATLHLGKTADWVAIAPDAVWVGSTGPYAVHRIDPRNNMEAARVALPGEPCAGLAIGFGSVWVPLCARQPALARVALASNQLLAVLPFGTEAECGIAASDDSIWLVTDRQGTLARIDPTTGTIRQHIRLPRGSCNPHYARGVVWITDASGAQLTGVDARSGAIVATVPTGPHPRFLNDDGQALWTLNQGDGSVTRVDLETRRPTASIALGTPGQGGDIAAGGGMIWTSMAGTPLTAIDPATNRVRRQWTGSGGDSLAVGHDAVWLTDYHRGNIARLPLAAIPLH